MITLLNTRFISFFLILWIITNVSVSVFPLQVLPHIYRYGYAFPFYNILRAVRSIVFRTKNDGACLSISSTDLSSFVLHPQWERILVCSLPGSCCPA